MSEYLIQSETLTSIADAIRAKTEGTDFMTPEAMVEAINTLKSGIELPSFITEINFGTFSYTTATKSITIAHGLTGQPEGFIVYCKSHASNPGYDYLNAVYGHKGTIYNSSSGGSFSGTTVALKGLAASSWGSYTADTNSFDLYTSSYNYNVYANKNYYWIAWR